MPKEILWISDKKSIAKFNRLQSRFLGISSYLTKSSTDICSDQGPSLEKSMLQKSKSQKTNSLQKVFELICLKKHFKDESVYHIHQSEETPTAAIQQCCLLPEHQHKLAAFLRWHLRES